ncbi:ClpP/crotonase-like domain-containing protein [Aspergillus pseudocaelatus]|uniref:ClpP/crotonase-like domain-containing protein n=1 Tax=Aspergillus pseudocaelatus TaxID=1825620 RepID=A0ABQ6WY15_9EURO|nr:ClpP/crotonase-like domain-containing protein [Aspergillus pseudocaelatus]
MSPASFQSEPPSTTHYRVSFPEPHIMLVTIDREKQRNSLPSYAHWEAHELFTWFDNEPSLLVAVVTGAGNKAFCAGQDLQEQSTKRTNEKTASEKALLTHPPTGFMGLSQRKGVKPVLAAVNGFALGGGFEICLNCDIIVASPTAEFGLPEAQVGLYAAAGGLPRLVRTCGMQVATELALTCRRIPAEEALSLRLINKVSKTPESVVEECLAIASRIVQLSPDAILATRQGLRAAWENPSVQHATSHTREMYADRVVKGKNFKIGIEAFVKKTKPQWVMPKI